MSFKPNIMINLSFALGPCSAEERSSFVGWLLWWQENYFSLQLIYLSSWGQFADFRKSIQPMWGRWWTFFLIRIVIGDAEKIICLLSVDALGFCKLSHTLCKKLERSPLEWILYRIRYPQILDLQFCRSSKIISKTI